MAVRLTFPDSPKTSDRLRNYSIPCVIASTRRVRGNLSATMRDCFTSFAMTTFSRCSGGP